MLNSDTLTLKKVIQITRSSEEKFKQGDFKAAVEDKRSVRVILNSKTLDKKVIEEFKVELSKIYNFKFDLINDQKLNGDTCGGILCGIQLLLMMSIESEKIFIMKINPSTCPHVKSYPKGKDLFGIIMSALLRLRSRDRAQNS